MKWSRSLFRVLKVLVDEARPADKEVDFILEQAGGRVLAIEVKWSESVSMADFNGIKTFRELAGSDFIGGVVLHSGRDVAPFGPDLWAVTLHVLW